MSVEVWQRRPHEIPDDQGERSGVAGLHGFQLPEAPRKLKGRRRYGTRAKRMKILPVTHCTTAEARRYKRLSRHGYCVIALARGGRAFARATAPFAHEG